MHWSGGEGKKAFKVHWNLIAELLTYSVVADVEQRQYDRVVLLESTEMEAKQQSGMTWKFKIANRSLVVEDKATTCSAHVLTSFSQPPPLSCIDCLCSFAAFCGREGGGEQLKRTRKAVEWTRKTIEPTQKRHRNQNVPSQRLDVDVFASAVDNHQMVSAVHRMLEQVQGRFDAFRASRLDVEVLARPAHRIRRLVVFVEHQQSFNGRIRWDEVRELSIIEFLREGHPKKRVKVSWRKTFSIKTKSI